MKGIIAESIIIKVGQGVMRIPRNTGKNAPLHHSLKNQSKTVPTEPSGRTGARQDNLDRGVPPE